MAKRVFMLQANFLLMLKELAKVLTQDLHHSIVYGAHHPRTPCTAYI